MGSWVVLLNAEVNATILRNRRTAMGNLPVPPSRFTREALDECQNGLGAKSDKDEMVLAGALGPITILARTSLLTLWWSMY